MNRKDFSTILMAVLFVILVMYIVIFPNEIFKAALEGTQLWFNVVFPALLPFFICVEILIGLGIVSFLGSCFKAFMGPVFRLPGEGSFAFFMSIASGYPVGAKITASLVQNNTCTPTEAQRMLNLCSTSGPLFIIGAVSTGILHNPKLGVLLAFAHYLSALSVGLLMRFWGGKSEKTDRSIYIKAKDDIGFNPLRDMLEYRKKDGRSFGILMGDAVRNGVNLILLIGGFIILFCVVAKVLEISGFLDFASHQICALLPFLHLNPQAVSSMIVGILEVTNGIKECALIDMSLVSKLMMVSFMIGFGGMSINAQVLSVIAGAKLRFGLYILGKLVQGSFAALYTYIFFDYYNVQQAFHNYNSLSVNAYIKYLNSSFLSKLGDAASNLILMLFLIALLALAAGLRTIKIRRATPFLPSNRKVS